MISRMLLCFFLTIARNVGKELRERATGNCIAKIAGKKYIERGIGSAEDNAYSIPCLDPHFLFSGYIIIVLKIYGE